MGRSISRAYFMGPRRKNVCSCGLVTSSGTLKAKVVDNEIMQGKSAGRRRPDVLRLITIRKRPEYDQLLEVAQKLHQD